MRFCSRLRSNKKRLLQSILVNPSDPKNQLCGIENVKDTLQNILNINMNQGTYYYM